MLFVKAALLLLCLCSMLFSLDAINGQVVIVEIDALPNSSLRKEGKSIPLMKHPTNNKKQIALLSIPYAQTKNITLLHTSSKGSETLHVKVIQGAYAQESLNVEPSKVAPPKEALERIKQERDEAMALYNTFNPKRLWNAPFTSPMESFITSAYGNARLFNNTLQSYHSGVDFRATIGTPVIASNDGVVVLAKDRYYAGESLVIDHGEGIYSVYYHLSHKNVAVGEKVRKGDTIGLSGMSGRVSGPHLHFGFMVQGIPVDPLDFIARINALFTS